MSLNKVKFQDTQAINVHSKNQINSRQEESHKNRFQVGTFLLLCLLFSHSLGYGGYIQGITSEVVFGQTYGMTSLASKAQSFHKGADEPANLKYNTIMKSQFIDHSTQSHETVAQIVGVERQEPRYARVSLNCNICNSQSHQHQCTRSSASRRPRLMTLRRLHTRQHRTQATTTRPRTRQWPPSTASSTSRKVLSSACQFLATAALTAESRPTTCSE